MLQIQELPEKILYYSASIRLLVAFRQSSIFGLHGTFLSNPWWCINCHWGLGPLMYVDTQPMPTRLVAWCYSCSLNSVARQAWMGKYIPSLLNRFNGLLFCSFLMRNLKLSGNPLLLCLNITCPSFTGTLVLKEVHCWYCSRKLGPNRALKRWWRKAENKKEGQKAKGTDELKVFDFFFI